MEGNANSRGNDVGARLRRDGVVQGAKGRYIQVHPVGQPENGQERVLSELRRSGVRPAGITVSAFRNGARLFRRARMSVTGLDLIGCIKPEDVFEPCYPPIRARRAVSQFLACS